MWVEDLQQELSETMSAIEAKYPDDNAENSKKAQCYALKYMEESCKSSLEKMEMWDGIEAEKEKVCN